MAHKWAQRFRAGDKISNGPRGGGDTLILDRGYSLAKLPRFFEGAEKLG